jgi:hypothetical protein
MNKHVFSAIIMGCLLILTTVGPARAQMPGTAERVVIPFDFTVRGKTLPAGEYEIRRFSDLPDGGKLKNSVLSSHRREAIAGWIPLNSKNC